MVRPASPSIACAHKEKLLKFRVRECWISKYVRVCNATFRSRVCCAGVPGVIRERLLSGVGAGETCLH